MTEPSDEQADPTAKPFTIPSLTEATATLTAAGQPFEMEQLTIRGIPTRTWKSAPASLRSVLELSSLHGDQDFLVYEDERISFAQHFRTVAALARTLVEDFGVQKGDRVAIAMRNLPEWVMAFWASIAAGAVVVPLNAWWTGGELAYGLSDSGTVVAFVDEERRGRILPELDDIPGLRTMIVCCEEPAEDGAGAAERVPPRVRPPPAPTDPRFRSFPSATSSSTRRRPPPCPRWTYSPTTTPPSSTPRVPPDVPRARSAPIGTASPT